LWGADYSNLPGLTRGKGGRCRGAEEVGKRALIGNLVSQTKDCERT